MLKGVRESKEVASDTYKDYCMKKNILSFLLVTATAITLQSCEKDGSSYYVKYNARYDASGSMGRPEYSTTITYTTPQGSSTATIQKGEDFEIIAGPFSKKEKVSLTGGWNLVPNGNGLWTYTKRASISISKGNGPFAVRVSSSDFNCSCTI